MKLSKVMGFWVSLDWADWRPDKRALSIQANSELSSSGRAKGKKIGE